MKSIARLSLALLSILTALRVPAHAQTGTSTSFRVGQISVIGLQKFTESEVVRLSGLSPNETVTLQDLSAAANHLARYGTFEKVSYTYKTMQHNMDLEFQVVESPLLPCRFDNFVWFSPSELESALTSKVPLYHGFAPSGGAMLKRIDENLESLLRQKGVPGGVQMVIPLSFNKSQSLKVLEFSVTGVSLPIQKLQFVGNSAISESRLEEKSKEVLGDVYASTDFDLFVKGTLEPLYGEEGYLGVKFDEPVARPVGSDYTLTSQPVSVTVQVHEGAVYDWGGVTWSGNQVFSSEALTQLFGLHPGTRANADKLRQGTENVRSAYLRRGYVQVRVAPKQELDEAAHAASYQVAISEGAQFRMGIFNTTGLPERDSKHLQKEWKIQQGQIFDATYPPEFMKQVLPELHRNGVQFHNPQISIHEDSDTHIVDVQFAF